MRDIVVDAMAELVAVAVVSLAASLFAVVGLLAEGAGLATLSNGQLTVGVWYLYMGGLALFVGVYLLGYRQVLPRLRALIVAHG